MASEDDEMPFLFYQIDLEGAYIKHPVWFQNEEVELIIGVSG